jgi:drug/metabolite transporter (DMT)-like permease
MEAVVTRDQRTGAFEVTEWSLLSAVALMWGSSYLFIEEGLEAFQPGLITVLRLGFGALTLVFFSRARTPVERSDLPAITLMSFFWMAGPFLLFPIAQQWIDSSLAGMISGGVPIFAALVASIVWRRLPSRAQIVGFVVGFAGVVAVSWPAVQNARSTALGVVLVLLATMSYGVGINLAEPLQRKYGSLPVLLRAQMIGLVIMAIPGALAIPGSSFDWLSLGAMIPLGCLGTGLAFVAMTNLVGRVGAPRASIAVYFIPIVAVVLGVLLRDESVHPVSLFGTGLVIVGAVLASRAGQPNTSAAVSAGGGAIT